MSEVASRGRQLRRLAGSATLEVDGWATVDLDRAEVTVGDALGLRSPAVVTGVGDDELLGARARLLTFEQPHRLVVLLEPTTEGRIAAALARHGEGVAVHWILVPPGRLDAVVAEAGGRGLVASDEGAGPFGREWLAGGSPRWGPFLLIAAAPPSIPDLAAAATIEP